MPSLLAGLLLAAAPCLAATPAAPAAAPAASPTKAAAPVATPTKAASAKGAVAAATGPAAAAAKLMPDDVFLFVMVRDVSALRENFKKTTVWGLYKDPAMQAFVTPSEKKATDFIDSKMQELWKEIGLENAPELPSWPEGRIVLGLRMEMVTRQVIQYDYPENGPPVPTGTFEHKSTEPAVIVVADMGAGAEKAKAFLDKIMEKAADKGNPRKREAFRGLDIEILAERGAAAAPDGDAMPPSAHTFVWAFKGNTLLAGSNLKLLKDVALRMDAGDQASLGDDAGFRSIMGKLSADQADISLFLSAKALITFSNNASMAQDPQGHSAAEMMKVLTALGIDGVKGVGAVMTVAPNEKENSRMSVLVSVDGAKRGLVALLSPAGMSTRPPAFITKAIATFGFVNVDPAAACDKVLALVREAAGDREAAMMEKAMIMEPSDPSEEPLDIRKDLLAQLAGPLGILNHVTKPYTEPGCEEPLLTVGVRDAALVDKTLSRLHARIIRGAPPEDQKNLAQELL
jgi:hypothetical protein